MRSHAAVAWAGAGAALGGLAALAIRGFAPWPVQEIDVLVPAGRHRTSAPWLRVRSLTVPIATATWGHGTQVATPALALVLAYGRIPAQRRASVVHGAIRDGLVDLPALRGELARLPRVVARGDLCRRLALIEEGAESYLEERGIADVFRSAGLGAVVFQHRIRVGSKNYRLDAFHPPTLTAFEMDSNAHHGTAVARQRDVTRDAVLATAGLLTVRFTFEDITKRAEWCREVAREVVAIRAK